MVEGMVNGMKVRGRRRYQMIDNFMINGLYEDTKRNWLCHWLRRNCLLKDALEGMVNGKKVHGRRRYQMIDNIMINGLYEDMKSKTGKRVEWRMLNLEWKTCPWAEHYD